MAIQSNSRAAKHGARRVARKGKAKPLKRRYDLGPRKSAPRSRKSAPSSRRPALLSGKSGFPSQEPTLTKEVPVEDEEPVVVAIMYYGQYSGAELEEQRREMEEWNKSPVQLPEENQVGPGHAYSYLVKTYGEQLPMRSSVLPNSPWEEWIDKIGRWYYWHPQTREIKYSLTDDDYYKLDEVKTEEKEEVFQRELLEPNPSRTLSVDNDNKLEKATIEEKKEEVSQHS